MRVVAIALVSLLTVACSRTDRTEAKADAQDTTHDVAASAKAAGTEVKDAVSHVANDPDVKAAASSAKDAAAVAGDSLKDAAVAAKDKVKAEVHEATAPDPAASATTPPAK